MIQPAEQGLTRQGPPHSVQLRQVRGSSQVQPQDYQAFSQWWGRCEFKPWSQSIG